MDRAQESARDARLVEAGLSGDRSALEELVGHYYKPVYRAAYRILADPALSADVTQATFLSAFENLARFDGERKFFSWIYRIAVNQALDQNRKRARFDKGGEDVPETLSDGPEKPAADDETSEMIGRALSGLQESYRVVIVLRHYAELSYDEIADTLDIPVKTVRSRLYSARQLLKTELENHGYDAS